MTTHPLISPSSLRSLQSSGAPLLIFDCSFDLSAPENGRLAFEDEHIPGAVHADLHRDLSAPAGQGASGGRHPLVRREGFAAWVAQAGLSTNTLAVVYDRNRLNFAGRLWWMLRWVGHAHVAVLDGGFQAWKASGGPVETGMSPQHAAGDFRLGSALVELVDASFVLHGLTAPNRKLVDARATERYLGKVEPLDAAAGHIPGAYNRPFSANLNEDGTFKSADALRAEFSALLGAVPGTVIHYCGSGVSATPNVLAMEVAGFGPSSLYAGSWSEWSRLAGHPQATGAGIP